MRLLVFLFIVIYGMKAVIAQDVLIFKSGGEKEVIVKKVGVNIIEYIRFDNQNGPLYESEKREILMIKYANGTTDNFESYTKMGEEKEPLQTFIDERDGEKYRYIKIGSQVWMVDNLRYDNGSPCYANEDQYCSVCGRYYSFEEADEVCPKGWHLPSDEEWCDLEIEVGMSAREARKDGWRGTAEGQAQDLLEKGSTGLDLLLCGYMIQTNFSKKKPRYGYSYLDKEAYYWTASRFNNSHAYIRKLTGRRSIQKGYGLISMNRYPIRCIKD